MITRRAKWIAPPDTEVHVQRFFGIESDGDSSGSESVEINPDELVEEVRQLRRDVNELQAPDRADKKLGVEAGKGTMGALGGGAGGAIGTAIAPGVGTVAGQAVGTAVAR